ncbi:MAG: phosphoenolpyruvate synthase [Candidatus Aenigmarchaeota archaeon]|nr:phosphoenolpyruvate synthase [Candidatus Aenigmarchaeota archaeon]
MVNKGFVLWFNEIGKGDVSLVGGKNASLGEMISKTKIPVPPGFAITSKAYWHFLKENGLEEHIKRELKGINTKSVKDLEKAGKSIRRAIMKAGIPNDLENEILDCHKKLSGVSGINKPLVAVRSSATAEDLPNASFAGQQETYLNTSRKDLIEAVKKCYASLFTNRAISYRGDKGFDHFSVALSVGIQIMVESHSSGVMFTLDPDSGFRNSIIINASYGLGEYVVKGVVTPDEFTIFKPTMKIIERKLGSKERMLTKKFGKNIDEKVLSFLRDMYSIEDKDVLKLAKYGMSIEKHYKRPMDIEWAKDKNGKIFILQARPETVHSNLNSNTIEKYILEEQGKLILTGHSIGQRIGAGTASVIKNVKGIYKFKAGEVLVTEMTDPNWEPIMKKASAIITEKGGSTSHAAIVSRELGVPCIIDAIDATRTIKTGENITVDCTEKVGKIYSGILKYRIDHREIENLPKTKTDIFVNVGVPDESMDASKLPVDGIGLAREEFIITSYVKEHPLHMIKKNRQKEFLKKLSEGVAKIAAPFYPRPVIVRMSDFKSNEYAGLKGGVEYEPLEENPMIGWRGASRYINKKYEPAFRLECQALKAARDEMGLKNIKIMIPFCRTIDEGERVLKIMEEEGLERGKDLEIYAMAEIPSNIWLADKFSRLFDGFSIGSNDLTQLTLGIDRDNETLSKEFDERDEAVKRSIKHLIETAHKYRRKVGICGEAPSNYPEFVKFLVECGIDSISVNPDVAVKTKLMVSRAEKPK